MPNPRILVTEDQTDLRVMCTRVLQVAGYDPIEASSGQEALELAEQQPFDVLITDIKMPGMSGLDAYKAIRELQPGIVAVVMTGYGTLETAIEAIQLGVYEFVLKPFRPRELAAAVDRALERKRNQDETARLRALIPLLNLSQVFMSAAEAEDAPQHVVQIAQQEMNAETATLMLLGKDERLHLLANEGLPEHISNTKGPKLGQGHAGRALETREPLVLQGEFEIDEWTELTFGASRVSTAISLPLVLKDQPIGVLNVARINQTTPFNQSDIELLSVLGSQAAIAIENARLFREISDAYERLAELDHLKSEFINIAAHELRSPLAVVLAYAALLEDEATGQVAEHLGQVTQAAMQLRSIIDEMISLQRIDTGQAQISMTIFSVADTVADAVRDIQLLTEKKQQLVQVKLPKGDIEINTDQEILHLILASLLSNAVKFTPDRGTITVSASEDHGDLTIAVVDTGIGIAPEQLERIFDRFYQVEDSLRRRHGGLGLGLSIAREMAELIGGTITVESTVGAGSQFNLIVPL